MPQPTRPPLTQHLTQRLTLAEVEAWAAYGGDRDGWVRQGHQGAAPGAPGAPSDAQWALIDELVMGLQQVARGLVTPALAQAIEQRLQASAADAAVVARLRELAGA